MFPAILMGAMAAMQMVGGVMQSQQMRAAGKAQAQAGKFQQQLANSRAGAMDIQAGQERAAAQRAMLAERQQGALISGRTRALAAASGASLASPSIIKAMADASNVEDYRVGMARYEGANRAANLEYGADVTRAGGQYDANMGKFQQGMANQQANMAIFGGAMNAASMGMNAASAMPSDDDDAVPGLEMGGWSNSPSLLQSGSPMYQRYGFGGPK